MWDPHEEKDKNLLEMVLRRAARYCFNNYFENTPEVVTNMLQNLGWETLCERRRTNRLSMLFKIKNNEVGIDPSEYLKNSDPRTRGNRFQPDQDNHKVIFHSFFPRTVSAWNQLPTSVTSAPTLASFRERLSGSVVQPQPPSP